MSYLIKLAIVIAVGVVASASLATASPITAVGTLGISNGFTLGMNPTPYDFWSGAFDLSDPTATQHIWSQFSENDDRTRLTIINVSGIHVIPTNPFNPIRSLEADLFLSISAQENAKFDLDGGFSFLSSVPGSDSYMSASLRCVTTDSLLFDWKRNMPSSTYFWEIGDVASSQDFIAGTNRGFLQAGKEYELKWHVRISNPTSGTASGQSLGPLVFEFAAVPEPSSIALTSIALLALAARRRRK